MDLNHEQYGEGLRGTRTPVFRGTDEDGGQINVVRGSRMTGHEIDLVLRGAFGFAGLCIDLGRTGEESRTERGATGAFGVSISVAQSASDVRLGLDRKGLPLPTWPRR